MNQGKRVLPPAMNLVGDALADVNPAIREEYLIHLEGEQTLPTVRVNGLAMPIERLPWKEVAPFFERVFELANERFFGGELPACRLKWNKRLRRVAGRIYCKERLLELSAAHFEACGPIALGVVLLHEQIHLSLYEQGRNWGHTPTFKGISHQLGMTSIFHELPLPTRLVKRKPMHLYQCRCGLMLESKVKHRRPIACATCCRKFARNRFDERFLLRYVGMKDVAG